MAGIYLINADQGATLRRVITWQQPDETPVDVTGFTARMQVRPSVDSDEVVLELTTENGRILMGGADGTVTILVSAITMAEVPHGSYKYDLEVISPADPPEVTRLIEGTFKVKAEVTR